MFTRRILLFQDITFILETSIVLPGFHMFFTSVKRWIIISFQQIYLYLYEFIGKLLDLSTSEFPEPRHVFSGVIFTAFYMAALEEGNRLIMRYPLAYISNGSTLV